METKDIIAAISLIISLLSLFWVYLTNKRLEKYKAIIGLEKSYVETKLQQELRLIQELVAVLRRGRLLIEKKIIRKKEVTIEEIDKTLNQLEEKFTQALLFLEKTHASVENSSIVIFTHEQKNRIRNTLEELRSGEFLKRLNEKPEIENKLKLIKISEKN